MCIMQHKSKSTQCNMVVKQHIKKGKFKFCKMSYYKSLKHILMYILELLTEF